MISTIMMKVWNLPWWTAPYQAMERFMNGAFKMVMLMIQFELQRRRAKNHDDDDDDETTTTPTFYKYAMANFFLVVLAAMSLSSVAVYYRLYEQILSKWQEAESQLRDAKDQLDAIYRSGRGGGGTSSGRMTLLLVQQCHGLRHEIARLQTEKAELERRLVARQHQQEEGDSSSPRMVVEANESLLLQAQAVKEFLTAERHRDEARSKLEQLVMPPEEEPESGAEEEAQEEEDGAQEEEDDDDVAARVKPAMVLDWDELSLSLSESDKMPVMVR
mmetsp:Transcript_4010/g.10210  ORF Transcript_4010/g.10210 Transcript_4010/m.10210 type:complete len:274 (+) Transcript_4010:138-959(+)